MRDDLTMWKVCASWSPKSWLWSKRPIEWRSLVKNVEPDFLANIINYGGRNIASSVRAEEKASKWRKMAYPSVPKTLGGTNVHVKIEIMLVVFCDAKDVVHKEFVSSGKTITLPTMLMLSKDLAEENFPWRRRSSLPGYLLHHEISPSHTVLRIHEFLAMYNLARLP